MNAINILQSKIFVNNPAAPEHEVFCQLVQQVLCKANRALNKKEIHNLLKRELGEDFSSNLIDSGIKHGVEGKTLTELENGKLWVNEEVQLEYKASHDMFLEKEQLFFNELKSKILQEVSCELKDEEISQLFRTVSELIYAIINEYNIEIGDALQEGLDQVLKTSYLSAEAVNKKITATLNKIFPSTDQVLKKTQVEFGLKKALLELSNEQIQFLALLLEKVAFHGFLKMEPTLKKDVKELLAKRLVFLDCNTILALVFSADDNHDLVREVIEQSNKLGVKLVFTPKTLRELQVKVKEAKRQYKCFVEGVAYLTPVIQGIKSGNIILLNYFRLQKRPNWDIYIACYEDWVNWLQQGKYGLELYDPEIPEESLKGEEWNEIESTLMEIKSHGGQYVHPAIIEHDTYHSRLIPELRKNIPADQLGNCVWFLTIDTALERLQKKQKLFPKPFCKSVEDWAKHLMALSPCTETQLTDYESYIKTLIASEFGICSVKKGSISLDFLAALLSVGIPLDQLKELTPEGIRVVLTKLAEDREVDELLGQAGVEEAAAAKEEITQKLQTLFIKEKMEEKEKEEERAKREEEKTRRLESLEREKTVLLSEKESLENQGQKMQGDLENLRGEKNTSDKVAGELSTNLNSSRSLNKILGVALFISAAVIIGLLFIK